MMIRSLEPEIMDGPGIPDEVVDVVHKDLMRTHRWLGSIRLLVNLIRQDPLPVESVLDIGCGTGGLLSEIQKNLPVQAFGIDLRVPKISPAGMTLVEGDATKDAMPKCDVAIAAFMVHHLSEEELENMIRNVRQYCRRLIILDPVRNRLPLFFFRTFAPLFVNRINVLDGVQSIRRSFTSEELESIIACAVGASATFTVRVAPFYVRQVADISFRK